MAKRIKKTEKINTKGDSFFFRMVDYRYIYIMHNYMALRCKIGISTNPGIRAQEVTASVFGRVTVVMCLPVPFAGFWEAFMHVIFRFSHSPISGNGGTEFFHIIISPLARMVLLTIYVFMQFVNVAFITITFLTLNFLWQNLAK